MWKLPTEMRSCLSSRTCSLHLWNALNAMAHSWREIAYRSGLHLTLDLILSIKQQSVSLLDLPLWVLTIFHVRVVVRIHKVICQNLGISATQVSTEYRQIYCRLWLHASWDTVESGAGSCWISKVQKNFRCHKLIPVQEDSWKLHKTPDCRQELQAVLGHCHE